LRETKSPTVTVRRNLNYWKILFISVDDGEGNISFKDILLDNSNNPETQYLRTLFWEILNESLQELPEEQRDVFVWNELEDVSFKEIAERTGEKVNTLISRKRYAVLFLRERLQSLYSEIINH
jgi:RNA polymerase sigma factor (sigma-70 family)